MKAKKNMCVLLLFTFMPFMIIFSWYKTIMSEKNIKLEYKELIETAQINEEKGAYITAAGNYVKALSIEPENSEIMLCVAENYLKCGDKSKFLKYCNMAAEADPSSEMPYILMSEYYRLSCDYVRAYEAVSQFPEYECSEDVIKIREELKRMYTIGYRKYKYMSGFAEGYSAVQDENGKWGLADIKGEICLPVRYDAIGAYCPDEEIVPVCMDGQWYFSDLKNRKKYVPDSQCTYLGTFSDGYAPFEIDGKYGYTDLEYNETDCIYDYAGAFSDGVAAVSKNGKWSIINNKFENITKYIYDEIETDDYGLCLHNGKIYAIFEGEKICIDKKGNQISDEKLYSCELTPFCNGELWGYVDENENIVIDAIFDEVSDFSKKGTAIVREGDEYCVIKLAIYK